MANEKEGYASPNLLAPKAEKKKPSFGVKVARWIVEATREYVEIRNTKIAKLKKFSNGNQPVQPYLDQMGVDGKTTKLAIRFKANPIAPKFKRVIVNGYTQRKEKVRLESLSKDVKDRKDKRRNDAMFRKDFADQLAQLQEASGVELEDKNAFVPESEDHNDIHYDLNDREKEELILQKAVDWVLRDIGIDIMKKKVLTECFEANIFGVYTYTDRTGRFRADFIKSEDCIYSNSENDELDDIRYAGRRLRMSISTVRSRFKIPREKEKELWQAAKSCGGRYGNRNAPYDWDYRWQDSEVRPYDDSMIDIAHVWWKCSDEIEEGFSTETAYEGYWVTGTSLILDWSECKNILREGEDKERVLCPFIFNMIDNDGTMHSKSLLDYIVDFIEVMDLTVLKIKQLVSKVRPNGYVIDVSGLDGVDLGSGELDPLELADIRNETGDTYWNSINEDGTVKPGGAPIKDDLASMGSQIQELIGIYNFALSGIRDYLGVNEYREGGKVPAKLGLGVLNAQLDSSNTATYSIYMAWATTLKRLSKHIVIRVGDELTFNDNPNKGLLGIIGRDNADLFKERKDITASQYDIECELEMESEQRQQREQNISTALAQKEIKLQDAEYIRSIGDYSLSMRYLAYYTEQRRKEAEESADRMQKNNAQYQTQIAVAGEEAKQETVKLELSMKKEAAKTTGEQERLKGLENMAYKLIELSFTNSVPIPPQWQPIVDKVLQNLSVGVDIEQVEKDREVEQIEAEEQQALDQEGMMAEQQNQGEVTPVG